MTTREREVNEIWTLEMEKLEKDLIGGTAKFDKKETVITPNSLFDEVQS